MSDRSLFLYTAGQIGAVLGRPVALFLTNNYLSKNAADGLAVVFLASTLGLAAIAADPHQRYYPRAFGTFGPVNGLPLFLYVGTLIVTLGIGCGFVLAIELGLSIPLLVAFSGCGYFLSEKLADEVLRFRLFEGRLEAWGRTTILRAILQLGTLASFVLLVGDTTPAWMEVLAFTAGNLLVFLPQIPRAIWSLLRFKRFLILGWLVQRGCRWLYGNWSLWLLALMTSGIAYLDRCLAIFVDRELFPLFMLVAMCLSILPMLVGTYYLNLNRRMFLERRMVVSSVLMNRRFLGLLGGGLVLGGMISTLALVYSRGGDQFPVGYALAIAALQMLVTIIGVLREIPYWRGLITAMIRIEGVFYCLAGAVMLGGWQAGLHATWLFALLTGCLLVRLVLYMRVTSSDALRRSEEYAAAQ